VGTAPLLIFEFAAFLVFFLFLGYSWYSTKIYYPDSSHLLIIFILIAICALIPLPDFLLKIISPKTFNLYNQYSIYLDQAKIHSLSFYSLATKEGIIKFIAFLIIFFVAANCVNKREQFKRLFLIIISLGVILAFYGIAKKYFILGKETTHSFSTFGNRNHYAGYMIMIASLATGYALYCQNKFKRFIFGFASAIICASVFLSLSRAGSLSLLFSLTLIFLLLKKDGRIAKSYWIIGLVVILALFLVSAAGFSAIRDRFMLFWQGLFGRWTVVRDSLGMLRDFPFFGVGLDNFQYVFPIYQKRPTFPSYYEYLHNDHFQLIVETGLIAAAAYFFFLFKIFREIFKKLKERNDSFIKGVTLGGLCGLLGVIFHSFFDFNFHIPATSFLFWLILGLIYRCVHTHFHYYTPENDRQVQNDRETF
jgi:O-antigen ligase